MIIDETGSFVAVGAHSTMDDAALGTKRMDG
jgi:hypothetical protein